jgi:ABC-type antimicrobial peptide transport system permease subunit
VEDVHHLDLDSEIENQMYLPFDQSSSEESSLTLATRSKGDVRTIEPAVSAAIKRLDPGAATSSLTMEEVVGRQLGSRRLALSLIGGFAVIALILALGGLFGVVSAGVTERLREIGVRSALGATPGRLVRMVAGQGLVLVLAGTAIGIGGMFAVRSIMTRFVVGVSPGDPLNLLAVAGLLGLVAMMAMIAPAIRASRVDPLTVMRSE